MLRIFKKGLSKNGGRNNTGKITVRHRGGGSRRVYKKTCLLFKDSFFIIKTLDVFDTFRSSRLAVFKSSTGAESFFCILQNFRKHIKVNYSFFRKRLCFFLLGDLVNNFYLNKKLHYSCLVKAAGCYAQVIATTSRYTVIKMPSGALKFISNAFFGCEGRVAYLEHSQNIKYKAGQNRIRGFRPTVRGVAINPVDHPHGGGEGKSTPGRPSVSPWGLFAKCKKND